MKMNMQVIGALNVMKNISYWHAIGFPRGIRNALELTAKYIEDDARSLAPKDTGALKASIYSKLESNTVAIIGDGVFYGAFQEFGTDKHAPYPFLRPALEANKRTFEMELKEILK